MLKLLKVLVVAGTVVIPTTSIAAPTMAYTFMSGNKLVNQMRAFEEREGKPTTLQGSYDLGAYTGYVLGVAHGALVTASSLAKQQVSL